MRLGIALCFSISFLLWNQVCCAQVNNEFEAAYALSQNQRLRLDQRLEYAEQTLSIALESGDIALQNDALLNLGAISFQLGESEIALIYFRRAKVLSENGGFTSVLAASNNGLGGIHFYAGNLDSAELFYATAIHLFAELEDSLNIAKIEQNRASLQFEKGLYASSLKTSLLAIHLFQRLGLPNERASCYTNAGLSLTALKTFDQALVFHRNALKIWKDMEDTIRQGIGFNNVGLVMLKMNNDSAKWYLRQGRRLNESNRYGDHYLTSWDLLSQAFAMDNLPDSALLLQYKVLNERIRKGDSNSISASYHKLGLFWLQLNERDSASYFAMKALEVATHMNSLVHQLSANQLLLDIELQKSNPANSAVLVGNILRLNDSLHSKYRSEAVEEARVAFDVENKERSLDLMKAASALQQERLSVRTKAISGLLFLLVVFGIGVVIIYRLAIKRRQANEALILANEKIELLKSDLQHTVFNQLQRASDLLRVGRNTLTDQTSREIFKEHESRIRSMSLIHNRLYRTSENFIKLDVFLADLADFLVLTYGYRNRVQVKVDVVDDELPLDKVELLALIVNEWITNSLKYAFQDEMKPTLSLKLTRVDNNYQLSVSDNGSGFAGDHTDGFGLTLVVKQAKLLNAEIMTQSTNSGLTQILTFPQ